MGSNLSGVGVYSRELLNGLAAQHPEVVWRWLYRPHRLLRSISENRPPSVTRGLLLDQALWRSTRLFHGLNQRLPESRYPLQVVTFHDLFVMTADYSTPEFRTRFAQQARHAADTADHIIAVSNFTAKQVIELLAVESSRVTVIPHGVRFLKPVDVPREKVILHVGAIQKRKNLVRLVKAFDTLEGNWRLILAGSAGFEADAVLQAVQEAKNRDRILITGYVGIEELARWYSRAMIFAFPSLDEGFGMPVLEAMAAGIPALTSNNSALIEVAGEAAFLVDPESIDQIREGLNLLTQDDALRASLVRKGLSRARLYTWERASAETWKVYAGLLRANLPR